MKQTSEKHFHFCVFPLAQMVWIHPRGKLVPTLCKGPSEGKTREFRHTHCSFEYMMMMMVPGVWNLALAPGCATSEQNHLRPLVWFVWESALYLYNWMRWPRDPCEKKNTTVPLDYDYHYHHQFFENILYWERHPHTPVKFQLGYFKRPEWW